MYTVGGTKPALDQRLISGLSAVYHWDLKLALFMPADVTVAFLCL